MLHSQYSRPSSPPPDVVSIIPFLCRTQKDAEAETFLVHPLVKPIKCPPKRLLLVFLLLTASRTAAVELHLFLFVHP